MAEPSQIHRLRRRLQIDAITIALAILLAACLFGFYSTSNSNSNGAPHDGPSDHPLVDNRMLLAAHRLALLAATGAEQEQAREAARLNDHEVDLAYGVALRDAQAAASASPTTAPLRQLSADIDKFKERVDAEKDRVDQLAKEESDQLDLAKAQYEADQDELDDMQADLARESGDGRGKLQRLLQQHEASQKDADQPLQFGSLAPTGTLSQQIGAWFSLRSYLQQLQAAAHDAVSHAAALLDQHKTLDGQLHARPPDSGASIADLRILGNQRKSLASLDQRAQDSRQLASAYQRWIQLVEERKRGVLHLMLRSFAAVLATILLAMVLNRIFRGAFHQSDRRRLQQMRIITSIALEVLAALIILLILFGPPTQLSTLLGLITAGLTVVMKDFIVAFLGWFTLMGKNGMHVGDWVEIDGVSGEVIEIGLFKTVLLEVGSSSNPGHPTGRRVAFSNSFAMEHHYFNFSTSGQWMWDEIQVTLPPTGDSYDMAQEIREMVERETEADASQAAKDWDRVTSKYGATAFSAKPSVIVRPGVGGLEVNVRYMTHAPQRNAVKAKLFSLIVDLLRKSA